MRFRIASLPESAADLKAIVQQIGCSQADKQRLQKLFAELESAERALLYFPLSFQQVSPGLCRIPLPACRLYLYYRVHVRDVTIAALLPQTAETDVSENYFQWPQAVRDKLPATKALKHFLADATGEQG